MLACRVGSIAPKRLHYRSSFRVIFLKMQTEHDRELSCPQNFPATEFRKTTTAMTHPASPSLRAPAVPSTEPERSPTWQIKLLYDGECPLCLKEVNFLRQRDGGRGLVNFVDIADPTYEAAANGGVDFATAMGRIHAVLPDGTVLRDVAVFRRVYEILGLGWVYAITRIPVIEAIANRIYGVWAKWRLPLTGRPDLATLIAAREQATCSTAGRCRID